MNKKESQSLIGTLIECLLCTRGMTVQSLCTRLNMSPKTFERLKKADTLR